MFKNIIALTIGIIISGSISYLLLELVQKYFPEILINLDQIFQKQEHLSDRFRIIFSCYVFGVILVGSTFLGSLVAAKYSSSGSMLFALLVGIATTILNLYYVTSFTHFLPIGILSALLILYAAYTGGIVGSAKNKYSSY